MAEQARRVYEGSGLELESKESIVSYSSESRSVLPLARLKHAHKNPVTWPVGTKSI
jgi:hypothetical protein